MSDKQTRRTFMRTTGVAAGAAILPGFAGATSAAGESTIEVKVDSVVENGVKHAVSLSRNPDTGEVDGAIISIPDPESGRLQAELSSREVTPEMYDISNDVLDEVQSTVFDGQTQSADTEAIPESDDEEVDVWGELQKTTGVGRSTDGPSLQSKGILEDVIDEIAAGTKDAINRIGVYFEDSPKGTDCDANLNSKEHRQLGTSIDYEKLLGELTKVILGSTLGAIATAAMSGGPGIPVGGIVGAVAGFAISRLKDSTYITLAYRDLDACTFGACAPSIRVLVSGVWMDRATDMLRFKGGPDIPAVHLENFSAVDAGYEDVVRISS